RAMAVLTQESIPPLSSTTAFLVSLIFLFFFLLRSYLFTSSFLNSLRRRIPNKLVQLQSQPHRQAVRQDPFCQLARLQPRPFSLWIFKHRRQQNLSYALCQSMLSREFAREFVIPPRGEHEFHFIAFRQLF